MVVQNELLEFEVLLQNPFVFDLELQTLSLSSVQVFIIVRAILNFTVQDIRRSIRVQASSSVYTC